MTETITPPAKRSSSPNIAIRIGWTLLILATLYVCYFSHLGAIGFVGPDEPRYAWVARDMAETGDWITPRLYGRPWFEKPVLYYWGAALSFKLFGVSEAAARLPSAVSALLATLALAWLAWRIYGAETARWLLLLLPTTVGMIGFSHAAATDMPFSAMLTVAMVCAAVILGLTRKDAFSPLPSQSHLRPKTHFPWLALILFGFFLGAAVLAKGPAAIILCGGAVFLWVLFTKRWREAFRLTHPIAIVSFCLTAFPWYILCARRNPDFLRVFIIEHNFRRYLTPEFQHIQPFWYYIPITLIALLFWTPIFIIGLRNTINTPANHCEKETNLLLGCWIIFTIIFFSISKSKLPGYVLPTVSPLGLLTANCISSSSRSASRGRWMGVTMGTMLLGLAIAICTAIGRTNFFAIDYFLPQPLGWVVLILIMTGLAAIILSFFRRTATALVVASTTITICLALALTGDSADALNKGLSVGLPTQNLEAHYVNQAVYVYKLNRSFQYSLNFYFHRELPEWTLNTQSPAVVFGSSRDLKELLRRGLECPAYMTYPAVIVCKVVPSKFVPH